MTDTRSALQIRKDVVAMSEPKPVFSPYWLELQAALVERDRFKILNAELVGVLRQAEAALGENLVWITDIVDPLVRQKNKVALKKLAQLNEAHFVICKTLAKAKREAP